MLLFMHTCAMCLLYMWLAAAVFSSLQLVMVMHAANMLHMWHLTVSAATTFSLSPYILNQQVCTRTRAFTFAITHTTIVLIIVFFFVSFAFILFVYI